jgi:hypothetical protein
MRDQSGKRSLDYARNDSKWFVRKTAIDGLAKGKTGADYRSKPRVAGVFIGGQIQIEVGWRGRAADVRPHRRGVHRSRHSKNKWLTVGSGK